MIKNKKGFKPISIDRYVTLHMKSNPGTDQKEIKEGLESALGDSRKGVRCLCGNPIWVVGSAVTGNACFTCITGEAQPDNDYEIDQAMDEQLGEQPGPPDH